MTRSTPTPFSPERPAAPTLPRDEALALARARWGVDGAVRELPSYMDQNFRIKGKDASWVLKIANRSESRDVLDLQNAAMRRVADAEPGISPRALPSADGAEIETVAIDGVDHFARLVTFLPGPLLTDAEFVGPATWRSIGALLGRVDRALEGFEHPAMHRGLRWDLARATWTIRYGRHLPPERRRLAQHFQLQFLGHVLARLSELPHQVLFNDANDGNLVVGDAGDDDGPVVRSLFDFGDVVHSPRVFETAIACGYAALGEPDPLCAMRHLAAAYDEIVPFTDAELAALFPAACMRLVVTGTVAARDAETDPDNEYIQLHEAVAWDALERMVHLKPVAAEESLREACGRDPVGEPGPTRAESLALRKRHVGPSLGLSYRRPLEIEQGRGAFLLDRYGKAHLDCVNNVCHVGHAHPRVVEAGARQMARLNTNTRYLHDTIGLYAARLAALLPDPLEVCYFVNSGSEANELALRLARAATGRRDFVVLEGGYHGHTSALIDLSHYKHAGPGGGGAPEWVHPVPCPDIYRGPFRRDDPQAATKYADTVREAIVRAEAAGRGVAGFFAEPLIGCGGQIVPPDGYLREAFAHARAAGAVCIADEVQVGFGRVGTHWWAFDAQGAVPDIVTLGKPIGNGHPMAAVVTTRAIAEAFDNGMEFFATFGGNPVSCAIGMAVLDVIEEEELIPRAAATGAHLEQGLRELAGRHETIGDVRGAGLYLGAEFVGDRAARTPDPERLARVIERCRDRGVLLSADGPDHNVLKIKPPMVFGEDEAELLLSVLGGVLEE